MSFYSSSESPTTCLSMLTLSHMGGGAKPARGFVEKLLLEHEKLQRFHIP